MPSFLNRNEIFFNKIKTIKFICHSPNYYERSEKEIFKLSLHKGNIINSTSEIIGIPIHPFQSQYYDNKNTKTLFNEGGLQLIKEIEETKIKNKISNNIGEIFITGKARLRNEKLKNIYFIISTNQINIQDKIKCDEYMKTYENLIYNMKMNNQKAITLTPFIEAKSLVIDNKLAELFYSFVENKVRNTSKDCKKSDTINYYLTFVEKLIKNKKDISYNIKNIAFAIDFIVSKFINNQDYYEFNLLIHEENEILYKIYQDKFFEFLESLNLLYLEDKIPDLDLDEKNLNEVTKKYSVNKNKQFYNTLVEITIPRY